MGLDTFNVMLLELTTWSSEFCSERRQARAEPECMEQTFVFHNRAINLPPTLMSVLSCKDNTLNHTEMIKEVTVFEVKPQPTDGLHITNRDSCLDQLKHLLAIDCNGT